MLSVRNISYKIMKKSFYLKGYNEKFPVKVPSVYAVVVVCVVVKIVKVPSVGIKYVGGETAQLASFAFGGTAKSFAPVNESADFYNFKQIQFALGSNVFHKIGRAHV